MKDTNFWIQRLLLLIIGFGSMMMVSCDDDDTNDSEDPDNIEEQTWEPYQLKANTAYDYDFSMTDEDNSYSGTARIEIGDPEVEVTGNLNGQDFNHISDSSDDINQNFISAVSQSPLGMTFYQPLMLNAFNDRTFEVGNAWSYSYEGSSISFDITETITIAGIDGYVVETEFTDAESGEILFWSMVVNQEIPLPLQFNADYGENETYYMELTAYEE